MKLTYAILFSIGFTFLSSCAFLDTRLPESSPKPLEESIGKNWQIKEVAPDLTDEREQLHFQTEQSVEPEIPSNDRKGSIRTTY
jgi:hypothetical protein